MPELEQVHAGHAPAILTFELVNRAYFAASISDRGDEFFDQFPDRHSALLAEQEAGFVPVGTATPADLGGKSGTWYQRDLQP